MQKLLKIVIAILILAAVILGIVLAALAGRDEEGPDLTQAGIAYLESLEQKDPNDVMEVLRQRRLAELEAMREELLRQVKADEVSPFDLFQDAVIMGDSRAEGYWYYGYVDQSRTLTGAGHTILDLKKQLDVLEEMNPQYVYLCYGLNDIKIGYWGNMDRFVDSYMEYVGMLRQRLPNAIVVVSSVLPYYGPDEEDALADPSLKKDPEEWKELQRLHDIPAWNAALAQTCGEHDVIFVDNSQISKDHENLWEPDGIHVKKPFYPYWVKNLVVAALEEGGTPVEEITP